MRHPQSTISFFFVFMFSLAIGQAPVPQQEFLFSSFFAEKQLSSTNITCFFQDSQGYMWIGTEDGLNYFNGKTIRMFKHDHLDKQSLSGNLICSISEDQQGMLWIATNQGISRLDPKSLLFHNYYRDAMGTGLDYKSNVYIDRDNNCWVFGGTIYKLDRAKDQFGKQSFSYRTSDHQYTGIYQDSKKRYWLSSSDSLYRFFPEEHRRRSFSRFQRKSHFFPVKEDQHGNLFCGTWNDGLYQVRAEEGRLDTIEGEGLRSTYATLDINGSQLLCFGNTFSFYDLAKRKISRIRSDIANPHAGREAEVSALLTDAQGQLWIGYSTRGIQILSPSNQAFRNISIAEKKNMFPTVSFCIQDGDFSYAGGWYNYSLVKLDKHHRPVKYWKSLLAEYPESENNLSDAWSDGKGNLWFSSAFGLIRFNTSTETSELFRLDSSVAKRSFFLRLLPEGDSVLWLSGYFCGLSRFSLRSKSFENWGAEKHSLYWDLAKDDQDRIWLADNSGYLTCFLPKTKTFETRNYPELTEGVIYNSVVFDSLARALWITCPNGLLHVELSSFAAKLYNEKNGLPTSQVNALQLDRQHRLWIATSKGLCMLDQKHDVLKIFSDNNGLPSNLISQMFSMRPNGDLYIGYTDGFSILETEQLRFQVQDRGVRISRIYEGGKILPIALVDGEPTVELSYDQNNLQIEITSNDLINPEDNRLLFRLEGYDKEWSMAPNGLVNYSKLAPGRYQFRAGGINHNGVHFAKDAFLTIVIHPPFWKTTWFIALMSLGLFALALLAARYVFTRNLREKILILEKEQAIEKERSRISQDMHDDLGSGLTKISILSEVAKTQLGDAPRAKEQLEHISISSRELVDNLQDIIWILSSKNDSLENLCAYICEYALKYFEHFAIDVQVDFPDRISALKLSEDQRRNILLVFKESFNNISKHSNCSTVLLKMTEGKDQVTFRISDNGVGFEKEAIRHFANGLSNMQKRMDSINGRFAIHSEKHKGTVSEFEFRV